MLAESPSTTSRHLRRITPLVLFALALGAPAQAKERLDPEALLAMPGVRLLAVEFYADWCVPCVMAVPRWKALQETYGGRGLRVAVVTVQSGGAPRGWSPDFVIDDPDGDLAQAWEATELPQAFLWSWQGDLLVAHGSAGAVDDAIQRHFAQSLRIAIEQPQDPSGKPIAKARGDGLRNRVRGELARLAKFEIMADEAEKAMIRKWRKATFSEVYSEDSRCKLGGEIAPNSVLKITLGDAGSGPELRLDLLSLESSCVTAWAKTPVKKGALDAAMEKAVATLIVRLTGKPAVPGGAPAAAGAVKPALVGDVQQDFSEAPADWAPEAEGIIMVEFSSEPPGAAVLVDGALACKDASRGCRRNLGAGRHKITMHLEHHAPAEQEVELLRNGRLRFTLTPNFGILDIGSVPSGLEVAVDGAVAGRTPLRGLRVAPGVHTVETRGPCHYQAKKRVSVAVGEERAVALEPAPRLGAAQVLAETADGQALAARVQIDGRDVGRTPGTFKASVCAETLTVLADDGRVHAQALAIREQETTRVRAVFGAPGAAPATAGLPAFYLTVEAGCIDRAAGENLCVTRDFYIGRTEVTQRHWKERMGSAPASFDACGDDCPVETITWWEALAYANAVSAGAGLETCYTLDGCRKRPGEGMRCETVTFEGLDCAGYRLPTEAEWELAARAGCATGSCGALDDAAWWKGNAESSTHPVATRSANPSGLFDTLGNVWEWVWDRRTGDEIAGGPPDTSASRSSLRVVRGCAWDSRSSFCTLTERDGQSPDYKEYNLGFRLARTRSPGP